MKKSILRPAAAVVSLIFTLILSSINVLAGANEVQFDGEGSTNPASFVEVKTYTGIDGNEISDFFGDVTKNLAPGDVKNLTIGLQNNTTNYVTFYIIPNDVLQPRSSDLAANYFPDKTAMDDLLLMDHVYLNITDAATGDVYYNDTFNMTDGVKLTRVPPNTLDTLNVTVSIDRDLGNEFQNGLCAVEFTYVGEEEVPEETPSPPPPGPVPITPGPVRPYYPPAQPYAPPGPAEVINTPTPTPTSTPMPNVTATPMLTSTPSPIVTVSPVPSTPTNPPDYTITATNTPKTGDSSGLFTFAAVAGTSLIGLIILFATSFRKKNV